MKRIFFPIFLFFALFIAVSHAQKIGANISYCTFYSPENGPYLETYIVIGGKSINYTVNNEGKKSGGVEIMLLLKKENEIVQYDKYTLKSPEIRDTAKIEFNLVDVKRFIAVNGNYNLEINLNDINNKDNKASIEVPVSLNYNTDSVQFSDIQLVESYRKTEKENSLTKNGYDMMPYNLDFFPSSVGKLIFYVEVYNTKKKLGENDFLINYSICKRNSKEVAYNLTRFVKQKSAVANPVFAEMDIKDLPSGNYDLVMEVKNKANELVAEKKLFFQRSNKSIGDAMVNLDLVDINNTFADNFSKEEIVYHLKSIYPIAGENERTYLKNLIKGDNMKLQKQFFYNFWSKRNSTDPSLVWQNYSEEVKKVNAAYGTQIEYGFESDRGRVYLQYGAPNDLVRYSREPGTLPYEIWQYYSLMDNNQRDVKFVFYNPDLVTNDYQLIHSDARGEIKDSQWKARISNTNAKDNSIPNSYGSHIKDFGDK